MVINYNNIIVEKEDISKLDVNDIEVNVLHITDQEGNILYHYIRSKKSVSSTKVRLQLRNNCFSARSRRWSRLLS